MTTFNVSIFQEVLQGSHLATLYKDKKVYTSEIDNATALGAAMVVYSALGSKNEPTPDLGLQLWKPTILIQ